MSHERGVHELSLCLRWIVSVRHALPPAGTVHEFVGKMKDKRVGTVRCPTGYDTQTRTGGEQNAAKKEEAHPMWMLNHLAPKMGS